MAYYVLANINNDRKTLAGLQKKGKPSPLKGRTYEEIFGSIEKAKSRSKVTSEWMKTDKNIRRYCMSPSKPQLKLWKDVRYYYPTTQLEFPIKKDNKYIWLDIAIPELKIDIEYDGIYWHKLNEEKGKTSDVKRDEFLKSLGWKIIRVNKMNIDKFLKKLEEGEEL